MEFEFVLETDFHKPVFFKFFFFFSFFSETTSANLYFQTYVHAEHEKKKVRCFDTVYLQGFWFLEKSSIHHHSN